MNTKQEQTDYNLMQSYIALSMKSLDRVKLTIARDKFLSNLPKASMYVLNPILNNLRDWENGNLTSIVTLENLFEVNRESDVKGMWGNILYPTSSFMYQVDQFLRKTFNNKSRKVKFLDVGCGAGHKLFLTSFMNHSHYKPSRNWLDVTGVELNPKSVDYWNDRLKFLFEQMYPEIDLPKVINEDALNFSYEGYDLIYLYQPIADFELLLKLYEKILDEMSVGSYLTDMYWVPRFIWKRFGYNDNISMNNAIVRKMSKNSFAVFTHEVDKKDIFYRLGYHGRYNPNHK